jgi:DNA replication and repair protein RecF
MLSQVDRQYATSRARFERILTQRNHLLKRIREGAAQADELEYWDNELARDGGVLMSRRAAALAEVGRIAAESHAELAPGENLRAAYQPKLDVPGFAPGEVDETEVAERYVSALRGAVGRDVAAGMTLQGPHRDELSFELDGAPASGIASRAQQRTIALSMRLAEASYLESQRGESPVLLMDDVLSEMDAARRQGVLAALGGAEQMLVTGTDWDRFPQNFTQDALRFSVNSGEVSPVNAAA